MNGMDIKSHQMILIRILYRISLIGMMEQQVDGLRIFLQELYVLCIIDGMNKVILPLKSKLEIHLDLNQIGLILRL